MTRYSTFRPYHWESHSLPTINVRFMKEANANQQAVLKDRGPIIPVVLSPHGRELGTQAPATGNALIDTGAYQTCIDRAAAETVGMAVIGSGRVTSATEVNAHAPIYAARIVVDGTPITINARSVYGLNLAPQGLVALIGRDVLAQCVLVYNGADDSFSLSI